MFFWCCVLSHSIFSHPAPTAQSPISVTLAEIIKKRFQRPLTPLKLEDPTVTKNRPGPSRQQYTQLNTSFKILSTDKTWTLFDEFAFFHPR